MVNEADTLLLLEKAADLTLSLYKSGMKFQFALAKASSEYQISASSIATELARRRAKKKKFDSIKKEGSLL